jgi:hemerythrin-like metal-binding protein
MCTKRRDSGFPGRNGGHISIIKDARYLRAFGYASKPNILIERQHDVRCESRIPLDGNLHVALLDQQHQELFETVNKLERALRVGEGNAAIDGILDRLMNYAGLHFAAEESLMERHEFPGLSTHRVQHEMFRKRMMTFIEKHLRRLAGSFG